MLIERNPVPVNEKERLAALHAYDILDSLPEEQYDAIVRLASYICEVPLAFISFIDQDRQWFKSKVGLDIDFIPRMDAFCRYTIMEDHLVEVPDATQSELFADSPHVTGGLNLRFYASAPLIDPEGYRIGSLCIFDMKPRHLNDQQRDALKTLAAEVISHLVLRKQKKELEENLQWHKEFYNLFNSSPEIHCIMDSELRILMINQAVVNVLGYNVQEAAGQPIWKYFPEDKRPELWRQLKSDLLGNRKSFEIETPIVTGTGAVKWISWYGKSEGDKWYASGRDITYAKSIAEDLEILSSATRKSPSGILLRDKDGKITWMNEALEKITGYTLEEMKGQSFNNRLLGPETDLEVLNYALKRVEQGLPYEVELQIYKKDQSPVWVFFSTSPYHNAQGELERQITVAVDITERKKADQQLKLLSMVASNTLSGVVINDGLGKVEWVNSAFEKMTGYCVADLKGEHLGDILKGELTDVSIIEKARELSRNKQSFEVDMLAYRKDGQPMWVSVINSVVLDAKGQVDKYIEFIIDITPKKKTELELIAAKEEALALSRAKDMFISVMSHEIRTPLNAVIGMSHLLLEDNPSESQLENLNVLKFSAENLLTLINDVLDFAKIETGNVELERAKIDLREIVNSVIASMQYKTGRKDIYLRAVIEDSFKAAVLGDRVRLTQILLNLVGNALKFTENGGVTLDVKVIEQSAKDIRIRFAVTDTGIGIAAEKINTIFESFKQAELDTTRKYGGTGLGLAITKRLVELHDSRINVDSIPGQGSTFWFTVTFAKAENDYTNQKHLVETGLNLNALVVDDNQINRLLINKVLKKWGATADFAENGQEAIEKIEQNRNYDVVLMDIHMPVMGGLEAAKEIRSREDNYFKQLPIIALTASMLNNQMDQIGQAGMNDYVLKPFEPKALYDKLSKFQKQ
ncbi:PAS domain S-box protein [Mucilaginibacter sp. RS28]|uniref:histidine kinase n=1 Tax=Mucilaginibacter straminoryzae TaxID=2932774 RepID=A0A9X1X409_9SPHI|nr:PAS domain S-box protein [Mucilaginibacter straminoryzae]MCJ8210702.1 PAS domain S-box protein [Mucilaginibacter straminoryzae]